MIAIVIDNDNHHVYSAKWSVCASQKAYQQMTSLHPSNPAIPLWCVPTPLCCVPLPSPGALRLPVCPSAQPFCLSTLPFQGSPPPFPGPHGMPVQRHTHIHLHHTISHSCCPAIQKSSSQVKQTLGKSNPQSQHLTSITAFGLTSSVYTGTQTLHNSPVSLSRDLLWHIYRSRTQTDSLHMPVGDVARHSESGWSFMILQSCFNLSAGPADGSTC